MKLFTSGLKPEVARTPTRTIDLPVVGHFWTKLAHYRVSAFSDSLANRGSRSTGQTFSAIAMNLRNMWRVIFGRN